MAAGRVKTAGLLTIFLMASLTAGRADDRLPPPPNPEVPAFFTDLGDRRMEEGRYEEAVEAFRQYVRILPKAVGARVRMGMAYKGMDREEEAYALFRDAVGIYPGFAEEAFREEARIDPKNAEAYYGLGLAFTAQKKHHKAAASFEEALQRAPDHAEARFGLGAAYLELGERDKAFREYETLKSRNPSLAAKLKDLI